jgi:hypothetical protein
MRFSSFGFWSFGLDSDFGFRVSDFARSGNFYNSCIHPARNSPYFQRIGYNTPWNPGPRGVKS